jgi:type I restriction enzyme M protein
LSPADPGERFDLVLANPPFGKKSSTMIVDEDGKTSTEKDIVERDDFWATTSNKQLIAQEIVDDLEAALEQFRLIVDDLKAGPAGDGGAGQVAAG